MSDPALAYDLNHTWTYADYKEWELKPGERYELIDGAAYAMSAPNTEHQLIVSMLTGEFGTFFKGKKCKPIVSPFDVRLFYEEDESDDTVVQPDLVVVCDPAKLGTEGCRGAPDLVVEILSPSNTAIEMLRKRNLYRDAGVREYWVIAPEDRLAEIYSFANGQCVLTTLKSGDTLGSEAFPGLAIPLDAVFGQGG
jgi:Uma2 family endonuclease